MDFNMAVVQDGFTILSVGFLVVFVFLSVLIVAMGIMGKVVGWINQIFPVESPALAPVAKKATNEDEEIAVAIAVALMQ